jgi:hypothetical protein
VGRSADEVLHVLVGDDGREHPKLRRVEPAVLERRLEHREPADEPHRGDTPPGRALGQVDLPDEVVERGTAVEHGIGLLPVEDVEVAEEADEALPLVGVDGADLCVEGQDGCVVQGTPPVRVTPVQ